MVRLPFTFTRYKEISERSTQRAKLVMLSGMGILLVTWQGIKIFTKESTERKRQELLDDLMALSDDPKTQEELLRSYGFDAPPKK